MTTLGTLHPKGGGDPIPLLKPMLLVGRRSRCDICLMFPNVSSQHCELKLVDGYWQVRDLDSRNGTKVNGQSIGIHILMPGDSLSIARHHYEIDYTARTDGPPPIVGDEDPFARSLLEKAGLEPSRERRPSRGKMPPSAVKVDLDNLDETDAKIIDWLDEVDDDEDTRLDT